MSFANPAALWGLLGLAVPVLIHLLNASRGRQVPMGDTRFIEPAQAQRLRQLYPNQWLLLALRCLLLSLLVLILAGPHGVGTEPPDGDTSVLISPLAMAAGGAGAVATGRQIAADHGTRLRVLSEGLPVVDEVEPASIARAGAFSRLAELDAELRPDQRVVLLIADDPRESGWRRPLLDRPVEWAVVAPAEPPSEPLRIGMLAAPDRAVDARHLRAALESLADTGSALTVLGPDQPEAEVDVLFVLGNMPEGMWPTASSVISDLPDGVATRRGLLRWRQQVFDIRYVDPEQPLGIIRSDDGEALLGLRSASGVRRLQWASRFHPDYVAMAADPRFPELVLRLIETVDPRVSTAAALTEARQSSPRDPLRAVLIVLLILCLLLERWFAERQRT